SLASVACAFLRSARVSPREDESCRPRALHLRRSPLSRSRARQRESDENGSSLTPGQRRPRSRRSPRGRTSRSQPPPIDGVRETQPREERERGIQRELGEPCDAPHAAPAKIAK